MSTGTTCLAFLIFLLNVSFVYGQAPDTLWTSTFGGSDVDWGYGVRSTFDGGYIISGSTQSFGTGSQDVWLIKTDGNGQLEWSYTFGESGYDEGYQVIQTGDSCYVVVGSYQDPETFDQQVWLIKTDNLGAVQWSSTFGGPLYEEFGHAVRQTTDGGFIISGERNSSGPTSRDVLLVKTDSDGNLEWETTFGGSGKEWAYSILQTTDSGYLIACQTQSFGAGMTDAWLIKTDDAGVAEWDSTYGGASHDSWWSAQQTADSGYILCGSTESSGSGNSDLWLMKVTSSGAMEWDTTFGGTGYEEGYYVEVCNDQGFLITGYTTSAGAGNDDLWVVRTDEDGNFLWDVTVGDTGWDAGNEVQETPDGGFMVTGMISPSGGGSIDVWLLKFNPPVGIPWASSIELNPFSCMIFPNPLTYSCQISYTLEEACDTNLSIYDLNGRRITVLRDELLFEGEHSAFWNGSTEEGTPVSAGVYFVRLSAGNQHAVGKLVLME